MVAAVVGPLIAFVQAATQLQEQTPQMRPKFFAIVVTIFVTALPVRRPRSLVSQAWSIRPPIAVEPSDLRSAVGTALLLGLSSTRVAVACWCRSSPLTPCATVRNSIYLAGAARPGLQPSAAPMVPTGWQWVSMFARRSSSAAIGLMLAA
jgi:hypothetical protein